MEERDELKRQIEIELQEELRLVHEPFQAYFGVGDRAMVEGEIEKAILALEKCIALKPKYTLGLQTLGVAYAETGRTEAAIECFTRCIDLGCEDLILQVVEENPFYQLAWCFEELGEPEKAAQTYAQGLVRYPQDYRAYLRLGRLQQGQGRYEEAAAVYQRAIEAASRECDAERRNYSVKLLDNIRHNLERAQARQPYEDHPPSAPWTRFPRL